MIEKNKFTEEKNILWVDDDVNRPALEPDRDELKERNSNIIGVPGPDGFIKIINEGNDQIRVDGFLVDCLLMDTMLPNGEELSSKETDNTTKTGLTLIKKLFESGKYENIPIIIYSVVDEDEIKDYCSEKGIPLDKITILNKSMTSRMFANKVVEIVEPGQKQSINEDHENAQS